MQGHTPSPKRGLHALAQRFVLLHNEYTNSEVSFDGWGWLTQAIANENLQKNALYNYSGRHRNLTQPVVTVCDLNMERRLTFFILGR